MCLFRFKIPPDWYLVLKWRRSPARAVEEYCVELVLWAYLPHSELSGANLAIFQVRTKSQIVWASFAFPQTLSTSPDFPTRSETCPVWQYTLIHCSNYWSFINRWLSSDNQSLTIKLTNKQWARFLVEPPLVVVQFDEVGSGWQWRECTVHYRLRPLIKTLFILSYIATYICDKIRNNRFCCMELIERRKTGWIKVADKGKRASTCSFFKVWQVFKIRPKNYQEKKTFLNRAVEAKEELVGL